MAAAANLAENSPKLRCSLRRSISPKTAASQNTVVPPTPRSTSYPSGSCRRSAIPERMRRTTDFTPSRRWLVPRYVGAAAASAATASLRIFDGPDPKRPSDGSSSGGSRMSRHHAQRYRGGGSSSPLALLSGHLAVPGGTFGAGPVRRDAPAGHAAERDGIADGEVDVTEHRDPDAEREPVVHERRAGAQVVGERVGPAQHQPGHEHDDDGGGEEGGVDLLTGVELAHVHAVGADAVAASEPAGIVAGPAVDAADVAAELRAPPSCRTEQDRDGQQDSGVHVDLPEQLAPAEHRRERPGVQHRARQHQHPEQHRRGPVRGSFDPVEARDHGVVTVRCRPGCSSARSMRRRRSRDLPSSRGRPHRSPRSGRAT